MPNCLTQPISHDRYRLHPAPPPPRQSAPRPRGLSLRTLNIRNGRGYGLVQAMQGVHILGFYLMILTDTNNTNQAYC